MKWSASSLVNFLKVHLNGKKLPKIANMNVTTRFLKLVLRVFDRYIVVSIKEIWAQKFE